MNRIIARYNREVAETLFAEGVSVVQMRALAVRLALGPQTFNDLSVLTVAKQSTLLRTLDPGDSRLRILRSMRQHDF